MKLSEGERQIMTATIGGMTCATCVRRVEGAVKTVEGVTGVAVDLDTARATITHEPRWVDLEAVIRCSSALPVCGRCAFNRFSENCA